MSSKRVRTQESYQLADGTYRGKIMDARERQFRSQYSPSGLRDVLSLRVKVFHKNGPTSLFYNVNWDWEYKRFLRTLENLDALPEIGEEFDPESLTGMDVEVTVANMNSNGTIYSNITHIHNAVVEKGRGGRSPFVPKMIR